MSGEAWEQRPRKRRKRKKQADYSKQMISDIRSLLWVVTVGGLLLAARGKGGGYRLNRPLEEYSIKSILERMEGPLAPVACLEPGQDACPRSNGCRTLPLWQGLDKVISDYLAQFTLADLCDKNF